MRAEPIDFIGTNRAIDDRLAGETILPDNMARATGRLPDETMRRRMTELVEALPAA